jgi:hypothetical protein
MFFSCPRLTQTIPLRYKKHSVKAALKAIFNLGIYIEVEERMEKINCMKKEQFLSY